MQNIKIFNIFNIIFQYCRKYYFILNNNDKIDVSFPNNKNKQEIPDVGVGVYSIDLWIEFIKKYLCYSIYENRICSQIDSFSFGK